ncbi:MAG: pyridoxal-phosphate dependent enzyme, partial [Candidatus Xenobia bacterium]
MSALTHLECSACGKHHDAGVLQTVCTTCSKPLLARYNLDAGAAIGRESSMWRYRPWMPADRPLTLGEGWTPVLHADRLARAVGLDNLFIKDESLNPTGSFKARG